MASTAASSSPAVDPLRKPELVPVQAAMALVAAPVMHGPLPLPTPGLLVTPGSVVGAAGATTSGVTAGAMIIGAMAVVVATTTTILVAATSPPPTMATGRCCHWPRN